MSLKSIINYKEINLEAVKREIVNEAQKIKPLTVSGAGSKPELKPVVALKQLLTRWGR